MSKLDDFGFSIDLTVRNEWKNIDLLRTSVQNCFTAVFADIDGCHAIAVVTGELIEVAVENPLKEQDKNAIELMRSIEWINSYPTPEAAYRARMLAIAQDDGET